jgi:hypothetical protein
MANTKDKMEFAFYMARHTSATPHQIYRLMRYGATLNRLATEQCNRQWTDRDQRKRDNVEAAVAKACKQIKGVQQAIFSNDPRGACLKLAVVDGFTTDWGREGICVPS